MGLRCWAINPHGLRKIPNNIIILILEMLSIEVDTLDSKMKFLRLQERDDVLTTQNDMLKVFMQADRTNLHVNGLIPTKV
nr:kinesin motor domain-containing protein [Tanacetum cinerariifolium]